MSKHSARETKRRKQSAISHAASLSCAYELTVLQSTPAHGGYPRVVKIPRRRISICVVEFNVKSISIPVCGVKAHKTFEVDDAHGFGCVRRGKLEKHFASAAVSRKFEVRSAVRKMLGFGFHKAAVNLCVKGGHEDNVVNFSSVHVVDQLAGFKRWYAGSVTVAEKDKKGRGDSDETSRRHGFLSRCSFGFLSACVCVEV